mmetsp:Transcript_87925/g.249074  ORF Transcript_87925/g.249074 Transcript_87925/m.249074 type:complete len:319 (+) Transcript_87925:197-1153(+)
MQSGARAAGSQQQMPNGKQTRQHASSQHPVPRIQHTAPHLQRVHSGDEGGHIGGREAVALPAIEDLHDPCGRLLHARVRGVDNGPPWPPTNEEVLDPAHLLADVFQGRVARGGHAELRHALGTDLPQALGLDQKADALALVDAQELLGRLGVGHDGVVGDLEAALGEVEGQRGLAGAGRSHEHHVCLVPEARRHAVINLPRVLDGPHDVHVLITHPLPPPRDAAALRPKLLLQRLEQRGPEVARVHPSLLAGSLQGCMDSGLHHGEDQERFHLGGLIHNPLRLLLGPHKAEDLAARSSARAAKTVVELPQRSTHRSAS